MRQVVNDATEYWPTLHVVRSKCGCCGASEEFQPDGEVIWRGYVYGAGTAHFCGMEAYAAPHLSIERDGDGLRLVFDDHAVRIPART